MVAHVKKRTSNVAVRSIPQSKKNTSQYVATRDFPTQASGRQSSEQSRVLWNLHTCLTSMGLGQDNATYKLYSLSKAKENALHLWRVLRQVVPVHFSSSSNNPCWNATLKLSLHQDKVEGQVGDLHFHHALSEYRHHLALRLQALEHVSTPIVCLPKVFILGFAKCGTTFLYCLVTRVAQLSSFDVSQVEKEPHWWTQSVPQGLPQAKDVAKYLFNFYPGSLSMLHSKRTLTIDASPDTIAKWPGFFDSLMDNCCLIPSVLPVVLPNSRHIVIMRDPVSTLYSFFWFSCSQYDIRLSREDLQRAPDIFHSRVVQALDDLHSCLLQNPIDYCATVSVHKRRSISRPSSFRDCGRIRFDRTLYYLHIRRWLSVIPREQFLFLTTEEMSKDTLLVAVKVARFLGLNDPNDVSLEEITNFSTLGRHGDCMYQQSKYDYHNTPALQMRNTTRQLLEGFYSHYNEKLAELLADERFLWQNTI